MTGPYVSHLRDQEGKLTVFAEICSHEPESNDTEVGLHHLVKGGVRERGTHQPSYRESDF